MGGVKGLYGKTQGMNAGTQLVKTNGPLSSSLILETSKSLVNTGFVKKPLNLNPKQIEEKRSKNLCFWCDDKFSPSHKCKNRQLYMITVQDGDEKWENII